MRRVMIMNLTVRENTRGAHCCSNHVKPRNLKDLRGNLRVTQGAIELRPETWTRLMVAVMRLPVGPDPGILPGSGP